ncbi:MAG: cupin domain-containing protein [Acidimicrobiales bacterium]
MPVVRRPEDLTVVQGDGYTVTACAGPDVFDAEVPMRARRLVVEAGASAPVEIAGDEAMIYVVAGSGVFESGSERHEVGPESMVWLEPPAASTLRAGDEGVELLVSEAPGR